jgi:eukaryotic-like serine/threonine-protein kinase
VDKRRYATVADVFRQAFAAKPMLADDLILQHRYNAACAAALAGCGKGEDSAEVNEVERARWRQQALDWRTPPIFSGGRS